MRRTGTNNSACTGKEQATSTNTLPPPPGEAYEEAHGDTKPKVLWPRADYLHPKGDQQASTVNSPPASAAEGVYEEACGDTRPKVCWPGMDYLHPAAEGGNTAAVAVSRQPSVNRPGSRPESGRPKSNVF